MVPVDLPQKITWNLYSAAVGAISALVTKKLVDAAWKFVTGDEPPEPNDPDTPAPLALAWVLAMAVGVGVSQVLVNRFAAKRWASFTGGPAPLRSVNLRL